MCPGEDGDKLHNAVVLQFGRMPHPEPASPQSVRLLASGLGGGGGGGGGGTARTVSPPTHTIKIYRAACLSKVGSSNSVIRHLALRGSLEGHALISEKQQTSRC